jgi:hypothetical protein
MKDINPSDEHSTLRCGVCAPILHVIEMPPCASQALYKLTVLSSRYLAALQTSVRVIEIVECLGKRSRIS